MKKDNLMFGVLGLVVGIVVGFMGANSMNRSASGQGPTAPPPSSATAPSGIPNLPPDHPPLGTSSGSGGDPAQSGPLPQVAEAIEKAKQRPQDYDAQMTAADLYYQIQKFDDAAKFYEAANKLKPGEVEPMVKAGNAYFDAEKYDQAERWYLQALQKNANNINVRTDLGLTFFLREPRDIDRAIKEYKTSLTLDPNHEITLQNLALAYTENGDKQSLAITLEKLRKVNPKNPVLTKSESN
ncbi:MAG: tetratricopeptide repeat protein [Pyrinomonadaceae bacterium]